MAREVFVYVAPVLVLDRGWLWHGGSATWCGAALVADRRRARAGGQRAHHRVLRRTSSAWTPACTALTQQLPRRFIGIYTPQSNPVVDAWVLRGRHRFGDARPCSAGPTACTTIVAALRAGDVLYLLPDMNFGPEESIFVPFYGVPAATVPSLSRFARLGRAKVVPVITRMTPDGLRGAGAARPGPAFPSGDVEADTALMNRRLQGYIDTMPAQYYWVHKRFKTRPPGEPAVY